MAHQHHPGNDGDLPLRAKILTVSDGVVGGTRDDTSGPKLEAHLADAGWEVVERAVIEDGELGSPLPWEPGYGLEPGEIDDARRPVSELVQSLIDGLEATGAAAGAP